MRNKTIFLDRDGVINKDKNYLYKIEDFDFIDGVFSACKHFSMLGYKIVVVTNQSGIARGYYTLNEYREVTAWMVEKFREKKINILDIFHCPHSPKDKCKCRKPLPGMLLEAKNKYDIDMKNSWLIGDKEDDITAANSSGIDNTILVRSNQRDYELKSKAKYFLNSINESIKVITE
jgi:D-glycero-D-manno-heptose 1,7-bisphosphate phosphatase